MLEAAQPWRARAACVGDDAVMFDDDRVDVAKAICKKCPVRMDCLAYALRVGEPDGVWGGATRSDRDRIIAQHDEGRWIFRESRNDDALNAPNALSPASNSPALATDE